MNYLDLNKLALPKNKTTEQKPKHQPLPHHKPGEKFLKGPIPLDWLAKAARLSGKAFHVAIAIWFWAGIKKTRTIRLSNHALKDFDISRYSKRRALENLEQADLILVKQHMGRAPMVTILDIL